MFLTSFLLFIKEWRGWKLLKKKNQGISVSIFGLSYSIVGQILFECPNGHRFSLNEARFIVSAKHGFKVVVCPYCGAPTYVSPHNVDVELDDFAKRIIRELGFEYESFIDRLEKRLAEKLASKISNDNRVDEIVKEVNILRKRSRKIASRVLELEKKIEAIERKIELTQLQREAKREVKKIPGFGEVVEEEEEE